MTWIKICGVTNEDDALKALSLGVDAVGFIFAPSPRKVDPVNVQGIVRHLPPSFLKVGVFVNQDFSEVEKIANDCQLSFLQFHGEESTSYCERFSLPVIKAFRIKGPESLRDMDLYPHAFILLDTYHASKVGGTGNPFPWEIALRVKDKRDFILSGGLTPENVGEAIRSLRPFGVDVGSGVESMPGRKDLSKMVEFVKEVKRADEKTR